MGNEINFAKKYWREFEELSVELISKEFAIKPSFVMITPPSQDDAHDGQLTFTLSGTQQIDLSFKVFLEAKLRSKKAGIGLRSFAATLVVAHNYAANALIIVSNQHYTPQAVTEAAQFAHNTRMQVRLVDGPAVALWVNRNYRQLSKRFSDDFLQWLIEIHGNANLTRQFHVPYKTNELDKQEHNARVTIGLKENGHLKNCLITFENQARNEIPLPEVIGYERIKVVERITGCIAENSNGISLIEGAAGSGKSFLITHAISNIGLNDIRTARINFHFISSVKEFFFSIFEKLVGINLISVLSDPDITPNDLPSLLATIGSGEQCEKDSKTVASLLSEDDKTYKKKAELNNFFLSRYIGRIAQLKASTIKLCLIFENLNSATSEVLDFFISTVEAIKENASILIELRTDGDADRTSPTDWISYQNLFRSLTNHARLDVPIFNRKDALELIEYWLPALGVERSLVVINKVGMSPLLLETACCWLKQTEIVKETSQGQSVIHDYEKFFEGINPEKGNALIRKVLDFWCSHEDPLYNDSIQSAALLNGELPIHWLIQLSNDSSQRPEALADTLIETGIFGRHPSRKSFLNVRHDLFRESLANYTGLQSYTSEKLATGLIDVINDFFEPGVELESRKARLYYYSNQGEKAYSKALYCAEKLYDEGQLSLAAEMWHLSYQAVDNLWQYSTERDIKISKSLVGMLELERIRNRIQLNSNDGPLAALETHLNLNHAIENHELYMFKMELLKWRKFFLLEEFNEAFKLSKQLISKAKDDKGNMHDKLKASAYSAHALSYKGMGFRRESQDVFKEGVDAFPNDVSLKIGQLSNNAAACLNTNPKLSLENYKSIKGILKSSKKFSLRKKLHTEVDLAMAYFLTNDYELAQQQSETAILVAMSNAYETEESRARNILACCFWLNKELQKAARQIDLAIFAAERSYYYRFLWRMRVNAAAIYSEIHDKSQTISHVEEAFNMIVLPRQKKIEAILKEKDEYRKERWYVALLSLLVSLHKIQATEMLKKLISKSKLPMIEYDLHQLCSKKWPEQVFKGTSHIHKGRIMITG